MINKLKGTGMVILYILIILLLFATSVRADIVEKQMILPFTQINDGYVGGGKEFLIQVTNKGKAVYYVNGVLFEEVFGKAGEIIPLEKATTKVSVVKGRDPSQLRLGLDSYRELKLKNIYKGIDLTFSLKGNTIEKIFVVKKGADPKDIKVYVRDKTEMYKKEDGSLVIKKYGSLLHFSKPIAYQYINGRKVYVDVSYVVYEDYYSFRLGGYDKRYDLFIDPLISGTFLGGSQYDYVKGKRSILKDSAGNIYVIGSTKSWDFPTNGLALPDTSGGDAFIMKLDSDLQNILAIVFIGGSGSDFGRSITIDPSGYITAVIQTNSTDAYTSNSAYQQNNGGLADVYVIKIEQNLSDLPVYATYFGGINTDSPKSVVTDNAGNVYVVGRTTSPDMPTLVNSYDKVCDEGASCQGDGFVVKFNNDLTQLLGFTYVGTVTGDQVNDIVLDSTGNVYVVGSTGNANSCEFPGTSSTTSGPCGFIAKFDSGLSTLLKSALTGQQNEIAQVVRILQSGEILVAGLIRYVSTGNVMNEHKIFLRKYNSQLVQVTDGEIFITGEGEGNVNDMAVDSAGNIYLVGFTKSFTIPSHSTAFQVESVNFGDGFIAKISPDLSSIIALTYIGGCNNDTIRSVLVYSGDIYIAGFTNSPNFPSTYATVQPNYSGCSYNAPGGEWTCTEDAFVARLTGELSYGSGPRVTASLCVHDFGIYNVGATSYTKEVRIYNFGGSDLTINSISISDDTNFSINLNGGSNPCMQIPKTVGSASYCSFEVTFTPQSNGNLSSTITIQSNDPRNSEINIELTGKGKGPEIYIFPNPIDFKTVAVNLSSSLQVSVRNSGELDLIINSLQISGDQEFSITSNSCSGKTLQPSESCTLTITFSPMQVGDYQAFLIITSNDPSSPTSIPILGIGATNEPNISVSPSSYAFGNVFIGANKIFSSVIVKNIGLADLNITDVKINGPTDFRVNYDTCNGTTLQSNQTCTIDIVFNPNSTGPKTATLEIHSNDPNTPVATVDFSGTGVPPPDIDVTPQAIDFGNVFLDNSATVTLTISNKGNSDLEISFVGGVTAPVSVFPGQTNPCPSPSTTPFILAPNQNCTYDITFSPTQPGLINKQFTITSNDPDENPLYINITGVGIVSNEPWISVDPTSVDFGVQGVNTQSQSSRITVSNFGGQVLIIGSVQLTDTTDFIIEVDSCSNNQLQTGNSCYIDVVFKPKQIGISNSSLVITSNDQTNPSITVTLVGEGIPKDPTISVDPLSYDFGDVNVGYSKQATVTVSNLGYDPLEISSTNIDNKDEFLVNNKCNVITYGTVCTIDVKFKPNSIGPKTATLEIHYVTNDPNTPIKKATVTFSGNAIPKPILTVDPNIINFGDVLVNTQKQTVIKVINEESIDITINDVSISTQNIGEFDSISTCAVLQPGESCNVTVNFAPITKGQKSASLVINYANDQVLTVQILGNAITQLDPENGLTKQSKIVTNKVLDFGKVKVNTYKEENLWVRNDGDKPITILFFGLRDGRPGEFRVREDRCSGKDLKSGESCHFKVGVVPSIEGKIRTNFVIYWEESDLNANIAPPEDHKEHIVKLEAEGEVNLFGCYSTTSGYLLLALAIIRFLRIHFLASIKRKRRMHV